MLVITTPLLRQEFELREYTASHSLYHKQTKLFDCSYHQSNFKT